MALRSKFFPLIKHLNKRVVVPSLEELKIYNNKRFYSAVSNDLLVKVDTSGVAVISMNKPPVNSLNLEMLQSLDQAIKDLEASKSCKGLILTSEVPKIFTAGLDILEIYQPKPEKLKTYWCSLQQLWIDLYSTKLISFAAITGHSPAGGCLLSLCCDYRIMVNPPAFIGFNETLLGIVAPFWCQESMQNVMGHRETEKALSLGKLYSSDEALKKGLVDELAPSPEEVLQKAQEEIKKWLKIPDRARQATKKQLREPTVQNLIKSRDKDLESYVSFLLQDSTQKSLGMYLESLKKKKG